MEQLGYTNSTHFYYLMLRQILENGSRELRYNDDILGIMAFIQGTNMVHVYVEH